MNRTARWQLALTFFLLSLTTAIYLWPGSQALFEGRTDTVLSDGSDPAALPYMYDQVLQDVKEHPSRLFYGSIYVEPPDPLRGTTYWMAWSERTLVVLFSPFIPLEQLSTAVVFTLLIVNGLAMYLLFSYLGLNFWVCLGAAFAWAFNPFTRARAKVHMAMAGTYHVPLLFLGLYLVARGRSWRSILGAALAFFLATTTVHYFIVTSLFLSPFFLIHLFMQPESRREPLRICKRLGLALLPALVFLGLNFAFPIPSGTKLSAAAALPPSGLTADGGLHPFLTVFAAHPIDYLAGDIALHSWPHDLNPLRQSIDVSILNNLGLGNSHERTNGIRWSLLVLAVFALASALASILAPLKFKRSKFSPEILFFAVFAVFSFWLSLSPNFPIEHFGPSGWLYSLVSQIRVPSRAGIWVAFSVLMMAGFWLKGRPAKSWLLLAGVFPALMIADYPPLLESMPMAPIKPAYQELKREHGKCGPGMYFPFASNYSAPGLLYVFLSQMRGSDCGVVNNIQDPRAIEPLIRAFPVRMDFLANLPHNLVVNDQILKLAACIPLNWIAFDPATPIAWRDHLCGLLGWTMNKDLTCVAKNVDQPLAQSPERCF